ncbi:DUF3068 domain-containing protein [Williamsia deligens]|uniref:DUF3068 domain-containing protein n=1 Tax=Williamsia deligens TaxID=321325 RepID=A0ABW3G4L9_9NOCA|nr:DUF3068 domain-containing protein [Williamsia deligens]MCP2194074.1 Protein of unknown function (DUF3068) [Williamsia deligens]
MATGRMSARDLLGPVLIFLGALLIVAAIAMPFYLVGQLQKTPMDTDYTTVSTSQRTDGDSSSDALPAKILNRCSLTASKPEVSAAALTRQQRVVAVKPAGADKVTFQAGTSTRINQVQISGETVTPSADSTSGGGCLGALLTATVDRVTTNRTSGAAALSGGGSSEVQLDSSSKSVSIPDRRGLQYKFPFDSSSSKRYIYFDLASRTTSPLKYVDSTEIAGVKVLHFSQTVPEANLAQLRDANDSTPAGTQLSQNASWYGGFPGIDNRQKLPADLYRTTTRDLYVEPDSGTIVNDRERIQEYYKISGVSGDAPQALRQYRLTNLDVTFAYDQQSQQQRASAAKDLSSPIKLYGRWLPIAFGIVGALALIAGIILLLRGPRTPAAVVAGDDPYYPVATPDDDTRDARGHDDFRDADAPTEVRPNLRKDGDRGAGGGFAAGSGPSDDDATQQFPRVSDDSGRVGWSSPDGPDARRDPEGPGDSETRPDDPWRRPNG